MKLLKRLIVIGSLLLFLLLAFFLPQKIDAYEQTEAVCYSQCAAYKFVWKGDFCWDMFQSQCTISSKSAVDDAIGVVKDAVKSMASGKRKMIVDVDVVFKALAICKPLIDCLVPQLKECENTCTNVNQTYYSPNLSVGTAFSAETQPHVFYSEDRHELIFEVVNNGPGYAWDIDVTASWGHTRNRDKIVGGGGTLFTEKIPELIFLGARMSSPKDPMDSVVDFLIDESNFSGYLSKYKSDANNHYIPPVWFKSIPFTAPEGEYTKVIFNVDPNKMIPESGENDNTYIYEIDKLPTPFSLSVENLTSRRTNPTSLTEYMVSFELKNDGEDSGNAHIKWFEGDYQPGKDPIHSQEMVIQGLNKANFDHILNVDVTNGGDSCNNSQKYTLVAFDDDGFIKTRHEFYLPRYAGSISGRVDDLFGKKIVGATVTASTGQSAITDKYGSYHIRGIANLGKVTLTATHPDFSKPETKETEITFSMNIDKCRVEGLHIDGVNFILKDQDVMFNVLVKDQAGNFIPAHVLASNSDWRFEQDVNDSTALPGMQPGQYIFTISSPGYKTISQTINAVPNDQNLEFVMEKLNGRLTDGGLTVHEPRLLWQLDRGSEILSQVTATKDGKRIIIYTSKNKANTGKLYFFDLETGNKIKEISAMVATGGNSYACLDASYDGNTTALYVYDRTAGARNTRNVLKLYNSQGQEFGTTEFKPGNSAQECDVSPDGFYILPNRLMNKGLYVYTRHDIYGIKDAKESVGYSSNGDLHFTTANNIVGSCPKIGSCVHTINNTVVTDIEDVRGGGVSKIDSSQDASKIAIAEIKKVSLFFNGAKTWEKDIKIYGDEADISVSPGGKYVIYSTVLPNDSYRTVKIFTDNNIDKTPANLPNASQEDVVFVHANDRGLYFLTNKQKILKFYKVASYSVDYNPPTGVPTITENSASGLSYYQGGIFNQADAQRFDQLVEGLIYIANRSINLDMGGGKGTLHITEGTIFSVDHYRNPVLLKGQLTADFNSPVIIYALKFDRYDLELFKRKLGLFVWTNKVPSSEYFIVKNIHTKFTVKNEASKFNVAVDSGEVEIQGDKIDLEIKQGRQIIIDNNGIKETGYINFKSLAIIFGVLILLFSAILFHFRKTVIGGKIIVLLKQAGVFIWKLIKKFVPIVWKGIKSLFQLLINIFNKYAKRK